MPLNKNLYSLAELDHEEALVEVRAAVGAADEVLLLGALVLATRTLGLRAVLEVLRLHVCGEEQKQDAFSYSRPRLVVGLRYEAFLCCILSGYDFSTG